MNFFLTTFWIEVGFLHVAFANLDTIKICFAIFDFDGKGQLFRACLFATIGVPILIWIYIWLYGVVTGKKTMSTVDFLNASGESIAPDEADSTGDEEGAADTSADADSKGTTDSSEI